MFKRDLLELILKGEKTATRRPTESRHGTQKYELGKVAVPKKEIVRKPRKNIM